MATLEQRFAEAIKYFWRVRSSQSEKQGAGGKSRDAGERTAVTGGGHLRGFASLICELLVENGIPDVHVFFAREKVAEGTVPSKRPDKQKGTELPGYFRATKDWDLIVVAEGNLVASVEFKSQIGPSFGNNFNNRTEEALGNATDLQTAFREGAFKPSQRPWLGFFMLLEDCPRSVSPVSVQEPHFKVFPEFKGASYAKRYELLCERLVRERLYDAACFVLSSRDDGPTGKFREPNKEVAFRAFVSSLIGHATAFVKAKKLSRHMTMNSQFDASASMLGYLFQVRLALIESLRRLKSQGNFSVTIEKLDDVAFEAEGQPADLLQTKLHIGRKGDLTDASEDLWKTIRIWAEGLKAGRWNSAARYFLITTSRAPIGSAAESLRPGSHNAQRARTKLDATVQSSTSQKNAPAYKAYTDLTPDERLWLFNHVAVLDDAPDITGVHDMLRVELAIVVARERLDSLITRIEGWWFQRVIRHLRSDKADPILSEEIEAELEWLRQQFRQDNLPIDADLLALDIVDQTTFASHVFVEQLRLIDLTTKRILTAMRQYFRASEQRSRWLREGFLHFGELQNYDRRLCEEWQARFNIMEQELGEEAAEAAMKIAARKLYEWAELESQLFIRPACREPFVSQGSFQVLSDGGKVGWHPEFLDRLKHLLAKAS